MAKRTAIKLTRWVLLLIALVLLFGLGTLFWSEMQGGREARETERIQSAQERVQETVAPADPVPTTP